MDKEIYKTIIKYKKRLEVMGIKVKKIVLYGSFATRNITENSDIDLVVISDDFKNLDIWERLCLLGRARIGIGKPMEILGYTDKEFNSKRKGSFIFDEVKLKGIEIK